MSEFNKYFAIGVYMNEYVYYNPALCMCKIGTDDPFPSERLSDHIKLNSNDWLLSEISRLNKKAGK